MIDDLSDEFAVSTWQRIDDVCDRFEAALRAGTRPQIEEYLTSLPEAAQGRLLRELILVDVEYRRTQGENVLRADYVARFSGEREVLDQVFDNTLCETVAIDPANPSSLTNAGQNTSADLKGQSGGEGGGGEVGPAGDTTTLDANLGRVLGSYRIVDRLGGGGMGAVYRAAHTMIVCERAIKLVRPSLAQDPQVIQRFLQEAQTAISHLAHPNIVKTFDLNRDGNEIYLVMELLDGDDLARLVSRKGFLAPSEAVQIIEQAATGLSFAHDKGFIHRDIKPHNIMLTSDGTVKILDLGLVRVLERSTVPDQTSSPAGEALDSNTTGTPDTGSPAGRLTDGGALLGTLAYMSPEQARDPSDVDARSDLFSLGCTFYFLLTGQAPFVGKTSQEVFENVLANRFAPPRNIRADIPPSLEEIVLQLLSAKREDRFSSGKQLARALRGWRLQERLEDSPQQFTSPLTYETTAELREVLTRLKLVTPEDWAIAGQIHNGGHREWSTYSGDVTTLVTRGRGSDKFIDALELLHRESNELSGLSTWQKNAVEKGNADLLRLPNHILVERVGVGWKGEVFKARRPESREWEAVRTFSADALQGFSGNSTERLRQFMEEMRRVAAVRHRALPKILTFDTCRSRLHKHLAYLATDYIAGRPVKDIVAERPWASEKARTLWAIQTAAEVARALEAAHQHGIMHLDIHDKTVRIDDAGAVRLLDLGIARLVTARQFGSDSESDYDAMMAPEPPESDRLLDTVLSAPARGRVVRGNSLRPPEHVPSGTAMIMPPEQWADRGQVTSAVDIYNLGCTFCYMLTGRYPFQGKNLVDLLKSHIADDPAQSPGFRMAPKLVQPVLEQMLAKKPRERLTAAEVAQSLERLALNLSSNQTSVPPDFEAPSGISNWLRKAWNRVRPAR